jgi:hypothetical protein
VSRMATNPLLITSQNFDLDIQQHVTLDNATLSVCLSVCLSLFAASFVP